MGFAISTGVKLELGILLVSNLTFSAPLGFVIGFDVIPPPEGETFALAAACADRYFTTKSVPSPPQTISIPAPPKIAAANAVLVWNQLVEESLLSFIGEVSWDPLGVVVSSGSLAEPVFIATDEPDAVFLAVGLVERG